MAPAPALWTNMYHFSGLPKGPPSASALEERSSEDQPQHEQAKEDEEDHLRYVSGTFRDPSETKDRRDHRDHKKYGCPFKHCSFCFSYSILLPCT